jgi:hypothetical protein
VVPQTAEAAQPASAQHVAGGIDLGEQDLHPSRLPSPQTFEEYLAQNQVVTDQAGHYQQVVRDPGVPPEVKAQIRAHRNTAVSDPNDQEQSAQRGGKKRPPGWVEISPEDGGLFGTGDPEASVLPKTDPTVDWVRPMTYDGVDRNFKPIDWTPAPGQAQRTDQDLEQTPLVRFLGDLLANQNEVFKTGANDLPNNVLFPTFGHALGGNLPETVVDVAKLATAMRQRGRTSDAEELERCLSGFVLHRALHQSALKTLVPDGVGHVQASRNELALAMTSLEDLEKKEVPASDYYPKFVRLWREQFDGERAHEAVPQLLHYLNDFHRANADLTQACVEVQRRAAPGAAPMKIELSLVEPLVVALANDEPSAPYLVDLATRSDLEPI